MLDMAVIKVGENLVSLGRVLLAVVVGVSRSSNYVLYAQVSASPGERDVVALPSSEVGERHLARQSNGPSPRAALSCWAIAWLHLWEFP